MGVSTNTPRSRWPNGINDWGLAGRTLELHAGAELTRVTIAYDTIATSYARHRDGYAFVVTILARLLGKPPGGSVLEVGCGTGVYATAMADAGADTVYGMDLSRQMLRQAPGYDRVAYL